MKTPTKFVKELSKAQREELDVLMKTGSESVRRRAHNIILSSRKYSVDALADIMK